MTRLCPTCSLPLPPETRARFCPRCSLRGALELGEDEVIAPLEAGRVIGDYELIEAIGRGGMGIVYRARQRSLNRMVAVKALLHGEFADEEARKRFQAEATSVAALRHPNIVTVHEVGVHDGQPYFSMELIEGHSFSELVRDGPLAPLTVAKLLKSVALAVQFAHEKGVLHRDLKPSNLLLDQFGEPRVSDFGLARRTDVAERLTLTGDVLGSPSYLAPEQARGDRAREGPASDVYSLGAILYHLLTGRPPFLGGSPQGILRQVIEDEPVSPRRLNPAIPLDLETICLKCIEKDPARRYATAGEVAEELNSFLTHVPLRARPLGPAGRAWRWSLRHPARAGLTLALAITLLTLSIVPTVAYFRIRRAELARESQLRETLLTQARAVRLAGNSGQRQESWPALVEAAKSPGNADFGFRLRREAIANLARDDAWFVVDANLPAVSDPTMLRFDDRLENYAAAEFAGKVRVFRSVDLTLTNLSIQHALGFSPDGRFLALLHKERVAIWDLSNKLQAVSHIARPNQFAFLRETPGVVFATGGKLIAVQLPGGQKLWERSLQGSSGQIPIAISAKDRIAVALGGMNGIALYDSRTSRVEVAVGISSMRWSNDGELLAAGGDEGSVRIWNCAGEERQLWTVETQATFVQALAFSPDRRWVAAASSDDAVRLIDLRTGRIAFSIPGQAFHLDFSPDGTRLGPVWQSGRVGWIHLTNSPVFKMARFETRSANPLFALDEAGEKCIAATASELLIYKTDFAEAPKRLAFAAGRDAYFLPNGSFAAIQMEGNAAWPGERRILPEDFGGEVASFSRDRRVVAVANYRKDLVDVFLDGQIKHRLPHERVACVALHPEGAKAVSTSLDLGETHFWNVEDGKLLKSWPDEGGNRVVFSPDGKWLAQFGPRCVIRDLGASRVQRLLDNVPANSESSDALFSPDGKWLAVVMNNSEIHLLRVEGFAPVAVFEAPSTSRLYRLAWSQNGARLAALAAQGGIHLWDIAALRSELEALKANWP